MAEVVNLKKSTYDVYIGRGSIYGNPYPVQDESDEERTRVISLYRKHFANLRNSGIITDQMLIDLQDKKLGCYCKPKACHGDLIKEAIDELRWFS